MSVALSLPFDAIEAVTGNRAFTGIPRYDHEITFVGSFVNRDWKSTSHIDNIVDSTCFCTDLQVLENTTGHWNVVCLSGNSFSV